MFTDGLENASGRWTRAELFDLITARKKDGWTFVFMGYPTEHSRDFPELAYLNLGSNPGTPFPLDVRLERTDTLDLAAPGPAKVVLSPAEAAPFPMTIPLAVEGGTLSTDKATLERGRPRSAEFTVTMNSAGETGAAVVIGPAPLVPEPMIGVHLVAADTLVLFTTSGDASDGEPDMAARLEEPAPGPLRSFSGVASARGPSRSDVLVNRRNTECECPSGHVPVRGRHGGCGGRSWSK